MPNTQFSQLTYNGYLLDDISTQDFTQDIEYTDDRTTTLYFHNTIKVKCYFNAKLSPANMNEAPDAEWARVSQCLLIPRQSLVWKVGATTLINSTGQDAKYGPIPKMISATRITNATWEIMFQVETWVAACCGTMKQPPALICNRWQESVGIDQNFYSQVTRKGKMFFRGDLLVNDTPDSYRKYIIAACPIKTGFVRTQSDYTVSSDGLALEYSITDKEVYNEPLPGLTDWEATHKTATMKGGVYSEEVTVTAYGAKTTPKDLLYAACAKIIASVLTISKTKALKSGHFQHDLHTNKVEASFTTFTSTKAQTLGGLNVPQSAARLGQFCGNDSQVPNPGAAGSARLKLVNQVIGDPCLTQALGIAPTRQQMTQQFVTAGG